MRTAVCLPELATTDRVIQRWAVSVGTGLECDIDMEVPLRSRPPPLDDDTAIIVDQIIMKCPPKTQAVIVKWYRTDLPNSVIAQQLRLSPSTLVTAWHLSLNFLQYRFVQTGHKGLLAMLRFREL
jgi:hypothetical protein